MFNNICYTNCQWDYCMVWPFPYCFFYCISYWLPGLCFAERFCLYHYDFCSSYYSTVLSCLFYGMERLQTYCINYAIDTVDYVWNGDGDGCKRFCRCN